MSFLRNLTTGLRALLRKQRVERELDEELDRFLEMAAEEKMKDGMRREEALRAVRLERGSHEVAREEVRSAGWESFVETCWQDLRYAARMLGKNLGFTAVVVLTLAIGIGANTAIFSVVNGVLLQPLPYSHPEQLVVVERTEPRFDHPVPVSGPNFSDWRARATQFLGLSGFDGRGFTVVLGNEPEHVLGAAVSSTFFSVLQVAPAIGRDFLPSEEHAGNDHVAILTSEFWKERFGSDANCVGRSFLLNGQPFTIIGVLPPNFQYVMMRDARIFVPLNIDKTARGEGFMSVIGRLKPNVSLRQAQREMDSIVGALEKEYPAENAEQGAIVIPMLTRVGMWIRQALLIMLAASGLVLLIACVNISNLTLAQAVRRHSEMAVRSALGASANRLTRQCLTESLLLGLLGCIIGVFLGYYGLQIFRALNPGNVPRLQEVTINVRVLLFSLGASVLASIFFGLVPAYRVSRVNLANTLKERSQRATSFGERGLLRQTLVVTEVALSLVILAGAGLAVRSFLTLISTDPGYDSRNLLSFYLSPQVRKAALAENFYNRVVERMSGIPGVLSVSMARSIPPGGYENDGPVITEKNPDIDPNRAPAIIFNPISANYFRTMRLPLRAGREFNSADARGASPSVILNEAAARSLFPDEEAVGKHVKLGVDSLRAWWTVVGVANDERYFGWDDDRTPTAYLPYDQVLQDDMPDYDAAIIIRTNSEPLAFLPAVRSALAAIDNHMALLGPQSMEQRLARTFAPHRFTMALFAAFGGLALVLAAVGIYGVMAQFVAQRTQEIGVRMALGARPLEIMRVVFRQGIRLALLGSGIGLAIAAASTRLIRSLLYGISPGDPIAFLFVAALLMSVVLLACYIPARRAMRVDPMVALRYE